MLLYANRLEQSGLDPVKCQFDSDGEYQIYAPLAQSVEAQDLKSWQSGFESQGEHQFK